MIALSGNRRMGINKARPQYLYLSYPTMPQPASQIQALIETLIQHQVSQVILDRLANLAHVSPSESTSSAESLPTCRYPKYPGYLNTDIFDDILLILMALISLSIIVFLSVWASPLLEWWTKMRNIKKLKLDYEMPRTKWDRDREKFENGIYRLEYENMKLRLLTVNEKEE
ncbi:hypothetical protein ACMFMG_006464 [Clarireedia jacksonii]